MLRLTIQKSLLFFFLVFSTATFAQNKPYRILTSGKDITIKSTKTIKEVLVWTTTGYRIVENRSVNNSSFSFQVKVPAKYVFVMIHFEGSKPYTEKLGL